MKEFLILLGLAGILIGGIIAYNLFNKEHDSLKAKNPDFTLSASELFDQFSLDEKNANAKYLDKIIEVSGQVAKISQSENGQTQVFLKSNDPMFGVICEIDMQSGTPESGWKEGDSILLKGLCSGFLMDVALNRCIPVIK